MCFSYTKRMQNRTAKRIYVEGCIGSSSEGWKRWIDSVKKKREKKREKLKGVYIKARRFMNNLEGR